MRKSWMRAGLIPLFALFLGGVAQADLIEYATTGLTYNFSPRNGQPASATTDLYRGAWDLTDPQNTATHELLHAIGFAAAYDLFAHHIAKDPNLDGTRNFMDGTDGTYGTGNKIGILTSADDGTHIPNSSDILYPWKGAGQTITELDKLLLNTAFNWNSRGLKISVVYTGDKQFTEAQKTAIAASVAAVEAAFAPSTPGGNRYAFTWDVENVPEPAALVLLVTAAGLAFALQRRKATV